MDFAIEKDLRFPGAAADVCGSMVSKSISSFDRHALGTATVPPRNRRLGVGSSRFCVGRTRNFGAWIGCTCNSSLRVGLEVMAK